MTLADPNAMSFIISQLGIYDSIPLSKIPKDLLVFDDEYVYIYLTFKDDKDRDWVFAIGKIVHGKKIGAGYHHVEIQNTNGELEEKVIDRYTRYKKRAICLADSTLNHAINERAVEEILFEPFVLGKEVASIIRSALAKEMRFYRKNKETKAKRISMMKVNQQLANQSTNV